MKETTREYDHTTEKATGQAPSPSPCSPSSAPMRPPASPATYDERAKRTPHGGKGSSDPYLPESARYRLTLTVLVIILFVMALVSLSIGRYSMDPRDVLSTVVSALCGDVDDENMATVLLAIRLPRMLAALLVGSALSLSGAVYQGVFRNPLVSPDLLGVSSGACVGAASAILLGWGIVGQQILAFLLGLLAVGIAVAIPRLIRNTSNMVLVLAGIITAGFMASVLGILKFVADPDTELTAIVFWQMGSLSTVKMREVAFIAPLFVVCVTTMLALSWRLNILSFGEVEAKTLGMNIKWMRGIVIVCASCLTASSVCISGTIGWIGLVIPHLSRLLVGSDHRKALPITLLLGGIFLLIIDTLARTITSMEIPLSILTGLIGAPFYAWLLYRQRTVGLS